MRKGSCARALQNEPADAEANVKMLTIVVEYYKCKLEVFGQNVSENQKARMKNNHFRRILIGVKGCGPVAFSTTI